MAAVLVGQILIISQTCWHTEAHAMKRLLLRAFVFVFLFFGSFYLIVIPLWQFPDCQEKGLRRYSQLSMTEKQELELCIKKSNEDSEFARSMGVPVLLASILIGAFGTKAISVLFRKSKN